MLDDNLSFLMKRDEKNRKVYLYNFKGELIFSLEVAAFYTLRVISKGIIRYYDEKRVLYIDYNGKVLMDNDKSLYGMNVDRLLSTREFTYQDAKDMLCRSKRYAFLKGFKVDEVYQRFIRLTSKVGVIICNYAGKIIIDTREARYCYVGKIPKESTAEIVEVGVFDDDLNKTYGYFDLGEEKEIVEPKHLYVLPWISSGFLIDYREAAYVIREEEKINFYKVERQIIKDKIRKILNLRLRGEYRNNYEGFIEYVLKEFDWLQREEAEADDLFFQIEKVRKIDKNTYLFWSGCNVYLAFKKRQAKWEYRLIGECYKFSSLVDKNINMLVFDDCIDEDRYIRALAGYKIDKGNMEKVNIFSKLMREYNEINTITRVEIPVTSSFRPSLKEANTRSLGESSMGLKTGSKEEIIVRDTFKDLVQMGVKAGEKKLGVSASREDRRQKIYIRKIEEISRDGNILWGDFYNLGEGIMDRWSNRLIINLDYVIKRLDFNGNYVVEMSVGGGDKDFLMHPRKGVLIGPVQEIGDFYKGMYIVRNNEKYYGYDENGELVVREADNIKWIRKFMVNGRGFVDSYHEVLQVTNAGFVYIIEDNKDYLIRQPFDNKELWQLLEEGPTLKLEKNR